tara:strand:+ start:283 stop:408 length:126 start_codon:yes stop_codon:yes gene_type:complete
MILAEVRLVESYIYPASFVLYKNKGGPTAGYISLVIVSTLT